MGKRAEVRFASASTRTYPASRSSAQSARRQPPYVNEIFFPSGLHMGTSAPAITSFESPPLIGTAATESRIEFRAQYRFPAAIAGSLLSAPGVETTGTRAPVARSTL